MTTFRQFLGEGAEPNVGKDKAAFVALLKTGSVDDKRITGALDAKDMRVLSRAIKASGAKVTTSKLGGSWAKFNLSHGSAEIQGSSNKFVYTAY